MAAVAQEPEVLEAVVVVEAAEVLVAEVVEAAAAADAVGEAVKEYLFCLKLDGAAVCPLIANILVACFIIIEPIQCT